MEIESDSEKGDVNQEAMHNKKSIQDGCHVIFEEPCSSNSSI